MIKNYFLIALRNLRKNRIFSLINVAGLSIGLTCCILIALFVHDELNFDNYCENASRIYRLGINVTGNGNTVVYPDPDEGVGPGIKNEIPEVENFTRILPETEIFLNHENKQFKEKKLAFADSNFLRFFSIPLEKGDRQTCISGRSFTRTSAAPHT